VANRRHDAGRSADQERQAERAAAERQRDRKTQREELVDGAIGVPEGGAEVAAEDIAR
jgi:hypothetical protein